MILSVDDGCASDLRLAELAAKFNVELVFYWPVEWQSLAHAKGYKPLSYSEALKLADSFTVGSHTITHRHLTDLPHDEALEEIAGSQVMLESLFDVPVEKFAPPRGYTNERLTAMTLDFYESQRLTKGEGLLHIHPDSGANGNVHWLERAKQIDVKEAWCHTWELDRYGLWKELEEYLESTSRQLSA